MTDAVLRKSFVAGLLAILGAVNGCTYWHGDLERIVDQSERDFRRDLVGPFADVPMKAVLAWNCWRKDTVSAPMTMLSRG